MIEADGKINVVLVSFVGKTLGTGMLAQKEHFHFFINHELGNTCI